MKACQLKAINNLIDMHEKKDGLLVAFIEEARTSLGNLCTLIETLDGKREAAKLRYIMISYGNILDWLLDLDEELNVQEGAA